MKKIETKKAKKCKACSGDGGMGYQRRVSIPSGHGFGDEYEWVSLPGKCGMCDGLGYTVSVDLKWQEIGVENSTP